MSADLTGQVAIVTGGGRGIGRAIALELARAGSAVGLVARSADELDEAAAALSESGARVEAQRADVTDAAQVDAAFDEIARKLGPPDLLVNNAGRASGGPIWEIDADEWWSDIEVNLKGPFLCAMAVLPAMREQGSGRIVSVGSNVGHAPNPTSTSYAASKAALMRLSDSLALAVAPAGIGVFVISPGMVRTRMTEGLVEMMQRLEPDFSDFPESIWRAPELGAVLVRRIAAGEADALSGRYIHVDDDLDDLIARADEIRRDDLHVLRFRR
jgi:NAD(P)-dependent dehydrogenase (short-subunit alcohol dehydrogenase family)